MSSGCTLAMTTVLFVPCLGILHTAESWPVLCIATLASSTYFRVLSFLSFTISGFPDLSKFLLKRSSTVSFLLSCIISVVSSL